MEIKLFEDILPGWYSVVMDGEARVVYKFVKYDGSKYIHYVNVLYDEVLRVATALQVPDGLIFTPIEWQVSDGKEPFTLVSKRELA